MTDHPDDFAVPADITDTDQPTRTGDTREPAHSTFRVLAALAELGAANAAAITDRAELGYSTVTPKLRAWEASGHAEKYRQAHTNLILWRLTPAGRVATGIEPATTPATAADPAAIPQPTGAMPDEATPADGPPTDPEPIVEQGGPADPRPADPRPADPREAETAGVDEGTAASDPVLSSPRPSAHGGAAVQAQPQDTGGIADPDTDEGGSGKAAPQTAVVAKHKRPAGHSRPACGPSCTTGRATRSPSTTCANWSTKPTTAAATRPPAPVPSPTRSPS
jgi:hypothetical protein